MLDLEFFADPVCIRDLPTLRRRVFLADRDNRFVMDAIVPTGFLVDFAKQFSEFSPRGELYHSEYGHPFKKHFLIDINRNRWRYHSRTWRVRATTPKLCDIKAPTIRSHRGCDSSSYVILINNDYIYQSVLFVLLHIVNNIIKRYTH